MVTMVTECTPELANRMGSPLPPRQPRTLLVVLVLLAVALAIAALVVLHEPPRPAPPQVSPAKPSRPQRPQSDPRRVVEALRSPKTTAARSTSGRSPASIRLQGVADTLRAPGAAIEDPCIAFSGPVCAATALGSFFEALDRLDHHTATAPVRIATLGNSLIASDHITDVIRSRLQEQFGDGGTGFVLADRISNYGRRTRTGHAKANDWTAYNFAMGDRGPYPFGVAGVLHASTRSGARTSFRVDGETRAEFLYYDHPNASSFDIVIDGKKTHHVAASKVFGGQSIEVTLPPGTKRIEMVADGPNVASYGAILEREAPGIIWNTFGVPAAGARTFLEADNELFIDHLRRQKPNLVAVMLGGNETKRLQWRKRTQQEVEEDFTTLLNRIRETVPEASCLAIGPIDAVDGGRANPFRMRPHLPWVIRTQRRIARAHGCAYLDLFAAMGGPGSLKRFHAKRYLHDDLVHPRSAGLDVLGELIAQSMLRAWERPRPLPAPLLADRLHALYPPQRSSTDDASGRVVLPRLASALQESRSKTLRLAWAAPDSVETSRLATTIEDGLQRFFGSAGASIVDPQKKRPTNMPRQTEAFPDAEIQSAQLSLPRHEGMSSLFPLSMNYATKHKPRLSLAWRGSASIELDFGVGKTETVHPSARDTGSQTSYHSVPLPRRASQVRVAPAEQLAQDAFELLYVAVEPRSAHLLMDRFALDDFRNPLPPHYDWIEERGYDLLLVTPNTPLSDTQWAMLREVRQRLNIDCLYVHPLHRSFEEEQPPPTGTNGLGPTHGCHLFSVADRIGGPEGIELWQSLGWLSQDRTLTDVGAERLGELLLHELFAAASALSSHQAKQGAP